MLPRAEALNVVLTDTSGNTTVQWTAIAPTTSANFSLSRQGGRWSS
jgi:hypothetical protein